MARATREKPVGMTPEEFRMVLEEAGLSRAKAAELLDYSRPQVMGFATGRCRISHAVALLIRSRLQNIPV
jgi:predicted XRE-type DNA-binding protein